MKKIWFVSDSEPIPQLTNKGRLMRAGKLAEYAAKSGNKVTWWTTTWLHYEERFYSDKEECIDINEHLTVRMLSVKKAYEKHVSVDRILYCKNISKEFKRAIWNEKEKPDVIHCSWPLIELGYECVKYGKKNNIPVVLDIRDMWPDMFLQPLPKILKPLGKIAIECMYGRQTRYSFRNAEQVLGVTDDLLNMSVKWGRKKKSHDHTMYLSYQENKYTSSELSEAIQYWNRIGITEKDFILIYIGNISLRNAQLDIIVDAAKKCDLPHVKYVLCGKGPDMDALRERASGLANVLFAGYRNDIELYALGKIASVGILPYTNNPDFINALPNKFGEYLFYGLEVFTTLKGASRRIIEDNEIGGYFSDASQLAELTALFEGRRNQKHIISERSHQLYLDKFNADRVYGNYIEELISL